jgi:hypothetical protein
MKGMNAAVLQQVLKGREGRPSIEDDSGLFQSDASVNYIALTVGPWGNPERMRIVIVIGYAAAFP